MGRSTIRIYAASIILTMIVGGPITASAAEWVEFNSAGTPPTPFQLKRAKAQGIELKPKPGTALRGLLFKPEGAGPFRAIVLLHSCRGIRAYEKDWATKLSEWGYVALLVDSFEPRSAENICADFHRLTHHEVIGGRAADAFGAHSYLEALPMVDGQRIAVMGWTEDAVLAAVFHGGIAQFFDARFQAAIAFYPNCSQATSGKVMAPVLVLMGGQDDSKRPDDCQRMADASKSGAAPIEIKIYPGVHHGFDDLEVGKHFYLEEAWNKYKNPAKGITFAYSREAHADAQVRVREFLALHLK